MVITPLSRSLRPFGPSIQLILIVLALVSGCIPAELAVNRTLGAKTEIYLACTDSPREGSTLHWVFENTSDVRHFEALLTVRLKSERNIFGARHEITTQRMQPGDRETIDVNLGNETCGDLKYIEIVRACNIAPMSCSTKHCEHSHSCYLVSPSGIPYTGVTIITSTMHELPSYVEVGIEPAAGGLMGCLVPADPDARGRVLSSRPWRCGEEPSL